MVLQVTAARCRTSSALAEPKGFAGAGRLDRGGFNAEIKQKNLPGRNPTHTRTNTHTERRATERSGSGFHQQGVSIFQT